MKHHIVIKFIAVVLCAVSLLGIVGSAVGVFAMTELGLYEKSFGEAYADYTGNFAEGLAYEIGTRYASMALGGCTTEMADQYLGSPWSDSLYNWAYVGYTLTDENGEVLQEYPLDGVHAQSEYSYDVGGSYIQVLSTMTREEWNAQNVSITTPAGENEDVNVTIVPVENVSVWGMTIQYADGTSESTTGAEAPVGRLSWQEDTLVFQSNGLEDLGWMALVEEPQNLPVYISFQDAEGFTVYEAISSNWVLDSFQYTGGITVMALYTQGAGGPNEGRIYDAIPIGGCSVSRLAVEYADGTSESAGGVPEIGWLGYDGDGFVEFTTDAGVLTYATEQVTHIVFYDEAGALAYEASDADGVGAFALDAENEMLIFRAWADQAQESAGEVYIYDDVPPQGYAVYQAEIWLKGAGEMQTVTGASDLDRLGIASHDGAGNVVFTADSWQDFTFSKPAQVVYILLTDLDGRVLYEAYTQGREIGQGDVIGTFAYNGDGELVFAVNQEKETFTTDQGMIVLESTLPQTEAEFTAKTDAGIALASETDPTLEVTAPTAAEMETLPAETTETVPGVTEAAADTTAATVPGTTAPDETLYPTETVDYGVAEASAESEWFSYYDHELGQPMMVEYTYVDMPAYTVEIRLAPGAMSYDYSWQLLEIVYTYRSMLFLILGVSLVVFAVMAVYLCCAAGRKPGSAEIRAGGLNCISLDLYALIVFFGVAMLAWLGVEGTQHLMQNSMEVACGFAVLAAFGASLLIVGFCFAFAAQVKTPGGYWWRNSLCGRCLKLAVLCWKGLLKGCAWLGPLVLRGIKACGKLVKFFWGLLAKTAAWLAGLLKKCVKWAGGKLARFFGLLPVTWQWLLVGFLMFLMMVIVVATNGEELLVVIFICACIGIIVYGAHCFGVLLDSTKRMSKGDLDEKVDDRLMVGSFREFAGELNSLADVAVVAAQKQLKSERMKTELITNVSHDIKTPLTSIINYVDLLQKPHTSEEQEVYLEVLDRQSQRLKKLIDDLMEMSKANTGNLAVDIQKVNAAEAINQALGEFADKLDKAQLTPVFRQPEQAVEMMADGRLVWRVMSNLLGNAVKYALPGTRVYLDLTAVDGKVIISIKNISREELNVHADELLERFVRGDVSRNTEGSGLGLNIAQSLMELQKGQLQLLVDGDLFKVTLIFPGV